jgi:tetratricopeptide (TPR) repeat protein
VLFDFARPDLIYMPHPHYQAMNDTLTRARTFADEYVVFTKELLHTRDFGIALLRNGRHYPHLARLVGDSLLDEAVALLNMNKPREARALAEKAAELGVTTSRAEFVIGLSWAAQNDLPRAVEAYRRSVALDSQNAQAYNNLGFTLGVLSQREAAIAALTEAVRLAPGDRLAQNNLAWVRSLPEARP